MGYNSKQVTLLGVCGTGFGLSAIVVGLRFFVRTVLRPNTLGWDDWTMLFTFGVAVAGTAVEILMVEYGVGQDMRDVNPENIPMVAKLTLLNSILSLVGTMTVKVSICFFILRIVHLSSRTVKWMVTINLTVLVPVTVATIIVDLIQCIPLDGYWDKSVQTKCINPDTINVLLKTSSGVGVATDFLTAVIPMVIVYRLQMHRYQKRVVYGLLVLGFLTAVASIGKTVSIRWSPTDYTKDNADVGYWSCLEHEGGIIVACIPTLRPLYEYLRHRGRSKRAPNNFEMNLIGPRQLIYQDEIQNSDGGLLQEDMQIRKTTETIVSHPTRGNFHNAPRELL